MYQGIFSLSGSHLQWGNYWLDGKADVHQD